MIHGSSYLHECNNIPHGVANADELSQLTIILIHILSHSLLGPTTLDNRQETEK